MKSIPLSVRMALPLACAAALTAQAAQAAVPSEHLPPPGLYRVNDIDSRNKHNLPRGHAMETTIHRAGQSGAESHTTTVFGASGTTHVAGYGSTTMCIPAPKGKLPHALPAAPGCKSAPATAVSGGITATMQCAHGDTTITTRRLNDTTWQFESRMVVKQSQVGRGDAVGPMQAMLEAMAVKGTPEEQAMAKAKLAELPKMKAQMAAVNAHRAAMGPQIAQAKHAAAQRGVSFNSAKPMLEQAAKYTITRIGDTCGG